MTQSSQHANLSSALSGMRILELTQTGAGASCAEFLAWLGADVVKVEEPTHGDSSRHATTEKPGVDSYYFIVHNANKRSLTCDLETAHGREQLKKLIMVADVLIENLAPGAIERYGLGYAAAHKLNPRLVYVQIKGFASDGPRAEYLSDDVIAQAVGGALSGTGYLGGPPLRPGVAIADTSAALHGAMGVLAALHQRRITGCGQHIEIDVQGAVINANRNSYQLQLKQGKPAGRMGNTSRGGGVPSNLYACKPGGPNDHVFIAISPSANKHWQALLTAMGREDLADDTGFSTPVARSKRRDEVDAMVAAWCRGRTKTEVMEAVQGAGAPSGAVFDMRDLSEDPDLRRRGTFATITHPVRGTITMPGWPVRMSASHVPLRSAPLLGAHTQEVLSEWVTPREPAPVAANLSTSNADTKRALAGVRVVDLTQFEAGTSCTESLAWLGADVVKVEEPELGDRGRYGKSDKPGVDSHYFILLNANKRSVTCDLKSNEGKTLLKKLIANADVLIENMAPGVIERLGFSYDVVRELNPKIIFAQIKGFPSDGRYASYLCFDMIAQAVGGSVSLTGAAGRHPLRPGPNLGDTGSGLHCATGILAALCQRQATGLGQHVEVAMQEAVLNFSRIGHAAYLTSGHAPERHGNRSMNGANAPCELFPCLGGAADDYCFIHTSETGNEQWHRLLHAIGKPEAIADPRFASPLERFRHADEVCALLAAWCEKRTKFEVMDTLQHAGVPAGAILDTQEILNDPHLHKIGVVATMDHPEYGPIKIPAWPVRMSESRVPVRSAPILGAHTEEVLLEWLGIRHR